MYVYMHVYTLLRNDSVARLYHLSRRCQDCTPPIVRVPTKISTRPKLIFQSKLQSFCRINKLFQLNWINNRLNAFNVYTVDRKYCNSMMDAYICDNNKIIFTI